MARTLGEIYDQIIAEKQTLSELNGLVPNSNNLFENLLADLSSSSKVAIWRLWAYVIAFAIWQHEQLWDLFLLQIQDIAATAVAGTVRWYQEQILAFQFGDVLVYQDGQYQYAEIDETAKIVAFCAISEREDGVVVIKTAKADASGDPEALAAPELAALQSYVDKVKFAGTRISLNSFDADQIRVYYEIFYDPIIPQTTVQASVEAAVDAYIKNLPFDGVLNITKLTDALQVVEGVVDPVFDNADFKYGALPYAPIDREYESNAGYIEIDPAFPLSATFTYTPIT